MARNTKIQLRRGTAAQWTSSGATLAEGEIGYEIDTGRFKIGKTNGSLWSALPYAGGSDIIPGTGVATLFDSTNNAYTISSVLESSGNGLSVGRVSFAGNGLTAPSGSYYKVGLADRLQTLSSLVSSGIIVGTDSSGVTTRSLASGANIDISNGDGIAANPTISLAASLTGLTSVRSSSLSGNNVYADNLYINQNIDISLAAAILAQGPLVFRANPFIVDTSGIFVSGLFVGPSGSPTGVSLSGHKHSWSDITNLDGFCDSVGDCVDTPLSASTGLQLSYNNNALSISLSGQALKLHNLNSDGLIVRDNGNIVSRAIVASGSNILVGSGNAVGGNPNIGLNPNISIDSIITTSNVTVGNDLTVNGNLVVNGSTVTTNVETITVEDPSISIGSFTGVMPTADVKDRGIEFVYQTGNSAPITGFFGYDYSSDAWTFLSSGTNTNGIYSGKQGILNVGGVYSIGPISGTILTSTVASPTAPIAVTSTGQVNNLNSDYLDGQHGSYYRDGVNITGTINSGILPDITSAFALAASNPTSGYNFVNNLTVDRAGRLLSGTSGTIPTATSASIGLAKFNTDNFVVTNGDVTIKDGGVILGTETTGQYAIKVEVSGTGLSATTASATHGTNYVITSNATSAGTTGTIVARNTSNGGFTAGTITATGFVGDGSSVTGINAGNITGVANLSSGVLPTVTLSNPFPAADNTSSLANFINSITVDRAGRVTAATTGVYRDATTALKGIALFSGVNFDVTNGIVSIKTGGVTNNNLANSSMTFGSTLVSLGGSTPSFSGLTMISGTSEGSPTTLVNCVIDGGSP